MKQLIFSILFLLTISFTGFGQLDRTKKPAPGPAPEIKIGKYESFELPNGLKVFVVENHKLPRVAFSLVLDNDPILEGEKAGYISTAGELLGRGTKTRTKEQLDEEIDFIGASFSTSPSGMYGSALKKHTDKLVEIMADVLLNPSFPQDELEKIKRQTLSALAAEKDDADAISNNVASALVYGKNHPYGEITTEATVQKITLEDCKKYYSTYFRPNVAYLAIVGDITLKEAKPLMKKYFGKWQKADVPKHQYDTPQQPSQNIIAIVDRPTSVQSVIDLTYPVVLKPGEEDVIKARLMNEIAGGSFTSRLNMNLREKNGYTYGIGSSLSPDKYIGRFTASANVRNEVTDSAIQEIFKELTLMEKEKVNELELKNAKNYVTGSFARSLENPQTVASFAINTARYNLPKDYYANYLKKVQDVSIEDVQKMAEKYLATDKAYVVVVGKAEELGNRLDRFGEKKFYDMYANPVDRSKKPVPTDVTAAQVYQKYIEAIGGAKKLKELKDITTTGTISLQGMTLDVVKYDKAPDKSATIATMAGNEAFKIVYNGNKGYQAQMGQKMDLDGKQLDDLKTESSLFYGASLQEAKVSLKMLELADVDGKAAYQIEMTYPSGNKSLQFFDKETGLKLKDERTMETPQGAITQSTVYSDYKEVNGVKLPFKAAQSNPMFSMEINFKTVEINKGLKDDLFNVQ